MIKESKTIDGRDMFVCSDGKIFSSEQKAKLHEGETEEPKKLKESRIASVSGELRFTGSEEEQKENAIMVIIGLIEQHNVSRSDLEGFL